MGDGFAWAATSAGAPNNRIVITHSHPCDGILYRISAFRSKATGIQGLVHTDSYLSLINIDLLPIYDNHILTSFLRLTDYIQSKSARL